MIKIIAATIVLMAVLSTVSAKCDMMKEFKPDFDTIVPWIKARCKKNSVITDDDIKKGMACYTKFMEPHLTSENDKVVDAFVKRLAADPTTKQVCADKNIQDSIKKKAIKEIGMQKAMECKKEIEADCPKFKKAVADLYKCTQEFF